MYSVWLSNLGMFSPPLSWYRLPAVKFGPPVAPKPQRIKGINRSQSTPAEIIVHEEPSSFTDVSLYTVYTTVT